MTLGGAGRWQRRQGEGGSWVGRSLRSRPTGATAPERTGWVPRAIAPPPVVITREAAFSAHGLQRPVPTRGRTPRHVASTAWKGPDQSEQSCSKPHLD